MPRVHVFGRDHINTDEIIPARHLTSDVESELAPYAMEDYDPSFVRRVQPGDLVVAGADFGCGSSREHAVWALRGAGVGAVIAPNFARIFYRNAINNGFLALECAGIVDAFEDGDEADLDLAGGTVTNRRSGQQLTFVPVPQFALDVQRAGGWLEYMREQDAVAAGTLNTPSTEAGHGHPGSPTPQEDPHA
ncbi:3-isopropylmalate dehydratase small subunit [Deinococcus budaensis]|uniref:3-isopropylmalate dehydratase small subunit n=1 Tax=Deinococcus budaensis TaxID=1665626 RepID=A0A7W8GEB5_9DEIO|nr:3-isopropylmalate dehydratase small subunit [Deinococcus budaensis]MBB5234041.1 3-isopropylmalate/(R)-2-methylmalate dehydratase small subunit [Deinococcus budaensis]